MKQIIILFIAIFIFSCDSGGGSSEPATNCDACPASALGIEYENLLLGNTTCDEAYTVLGCLNVIEARINQTESKIEILYNFDFNTTGFEFDLNGITIDSISDTPAGFTVSNNDTKILGYNTTGGVISQGCGLLLTIFYTSSNNDFINDDNFISNIVFTDDNFTNGIPNSIDVCNN